MTLNFEERLLSQAKFEATLSARHGSHNELSGTGIDGDFRRFGIRDGLEISIYDLALRSSFKRKVNAAPGLTIVFLLQATGCSIIRAHGATERWIRLDYDPRTALMIYSKSRLDGEYDLPAGTRFSGVEIRATEDFLGRLDAAELFGKAGPTHPLTLAAGGSVWVGKFPTTRVIEGMASSLLASSLSHRREDLVMEARCLDLLTAAISVMREPLFCEKAKLLRDSRELLKAKNMLLRNLEKTWTIHDLARQVGLSEKRLKDGFRQQFGIPLYSFLQKSRMEEARTILARKGTTVTDVAMAVGYANPSRFSQLFLREFGVTPSMFKLQGAAAASYPEPADMSGR